MTTTREAALEDALKDTLDFFERHSNRYDEVNGKHPQTIVEEARAALATPASDTRVVVPGIDTQVMSAATDLDAKGKENPAWAFIDYEANAMSFGRWAKCGPNPAPYIRADLVLSGIIGTATPAPSDKIAEAARPEPATVIDRTEILKRLADGDTLTYSRDGDDGWFTKGDGAYVGNEIIAMRNEGLIEWVNDPDPESDYGWDTISAKGRRALAGQGETP